MDQVQANVRATLFARFLVNLPEEEQRDTNRYLYNVLQALWLFKDHSLGSKQWWWREDGQLRDSDVQELYHFACWLFGGTEETRRLRPSYNNVCRFFYDYYYRIPVYGAVVIDPKTRTWLLVKGLRSLTYSFPRGKVNKNESDAACAVREVKEESGVDISHAIHSNRYIDVWNKDKRIRLFLVELPGAGRPGSHMRTMSIGPEIADSGWWEIPPFLLQPRRSELSLNKVHRSYRHIYTMETRLALPLLQSWLCSKVVPYDAVATAVVPVTAAAAAVGAAAGGTGGGAVTVVLMPTAAEAAAAAAAGGGNRTAPM